MLQWGAKGIGTPSDNTFGTPQYADASSVRIHGSGQENDRDYSSSKLDLRSGA